MTTEIRQLEPQSLWSNFADLNAVPRPSKKEARVIEFMKQFGESLGLETLVDEIGNVIGRRPGTRGAKVVAYAAHLDTVFPAETDVTGLPAMNASRSMKWLTACSKVRSVSRFPISPMCWLMNPSAAVQEVFRAVLIGIGHCPG